MKSLSLFPSLRLGAPVTAGLGLEAQQRACDWQLGVTVLVFRLGVPASLSLEVSL